MIFSRLRIDSPRVDDHHITATDIPKKLDASLKQLNSHVFGL